MSKDTKTTMEELLGGNEDVLKPLEKNDTVTGTVVSASKNGVWLDLGVHGTGLAVGPELNDRRFLAEECAVGTEVTATVVEPEYEGGHSIMSLKRASKEKTWTALAKMASDKEVISASPVDANKGGLLIELEGIRGFLPVSQLSTEKYPRVTDKDEIQARLSELIGKPMNVVILDADEREGKLIFSEKAASRGEISKVLDKFAIGDKVKGRVTGVVDYGIFVNVDGVEGLVHISEISWERISDPGKIYKVGDEIDAEIIGIDNDRFSLSVKRLTDDPWAAAAKTFKVGDVVEGEITRVTPFGAFVRIHDNIEALVHISELGEGHVADPNDVVEVAKKYKFSILSIDKQSHKIALSLKAAKGASAKAPATEVKAKIEKPAAKKAAEVLEKVEPDEIVEEKTDKETEANSAGEQSEKTEA